MGGWCRLREVGRSPSTTRGRFDQFAPTKKQVRKSVGVCIGSQASNNPGQATNQGVCVRTLTRPQSCTGVRRIVCV
eukprot:363047-Chlamydomonas_euryale.AAC.9